VTDIAVDVRYPIGDARLPARFDAAARAAAIAQIGALPFQLHEAVRALGPVELDTPYRDGGWTVRQVVHHLADSHLNAYVRHKLVATEQAPPLKAYDENAWAALADAQGAIGASLLLIDALHARWVAFLCALPEAAFARTGVHDERGPMTLDDLVALYAWHGDHHVAQIAALRARQGW